MSGRVSVTLPNGRQVTGYRKTLAQRSRTPPHELPYWRLSIELPVAVSWALTEGPYPGIMGARIGPAGHVEIVGKVKPWVLGQAEDLLRKVAPMGIPNPMPMVLRRDDEAGPAALSGPPRRGTVSVGTVTWNGNRGMIIEGTAMRPLRAAHSPASSGR